MFSTTIDPSMLCAQLVGDELLRSRRADSTPMIAIRFGCRLTITSAG